MAFRRQTHWLLLQKSMILLRKSLDFDAKDGESAAEALNSAAKATGFYLGIH
jgi:hypothetical protein